MNLPSITSLRAAARTSGFDVVDRSIGGLLGIEAQGAVLGATYLTLLYDVVATEVSAPSAFFSPQEAETATSWSATYAGKVRARDVLASIQAEAHHLGLTRAMWDQVVFAPLATGLAAGEYEPKIRQISDDIRKTVQETTLSQGSGRWTQARELLDQVWHRHSRRWPDEATLNGAIGVAGSLLGFVLDYDRSDEVYLRDFIRYMEETAKQPPSADDLAIEQYGPVDSEPATADAAYFVSARSGRKHVLLAGPYETHRDAILAIRLVQKQVDDARADPFHEAAFGTARAPRDSTVRRLT